MKKVLISQEKSVHLDVWCIKLVSVGRKHRTTEKHWLNPIEKIWALVKNHVATYNTTFKLDDVRKLAEAKFEAVTVQQWQNICSHVEKIEVEYMKREYIVDEVEDLIISINGEESDESDFFLSSDEEQVDEKEVQGGSSSSNLADLGCKPSINVNVNVNINVNVVPSTVQKFRIVSLSSEELFMGQIALWKPFQFSFFGMSHSVVHFSSNSANEKLKEINNELGIPLSNTVLHSTNHAGNGVVYELLGSSPHASATAPGVLRKLLEDVFGVHSPPAASTEEGRQCQLPGDRADLITLQSATYDLLHLVVTTGRLYGRAQSTAVPCHEPKMPHPDIRCSGIIPWYLLEVLRIEVSSSLRSESLIFEKRQRCQSLQTVTFLSQIVYDLATTRKSAFVNIYRLQENVTRTIEHEILAATTAATAPQGARVPQRRVDVTVGEKGGEVRMRSWCGSMRSENTLVRPWSVWVTHTVEHLK
ncbi:hypothetical protein GEV33_013504 [Tenebrio molitor]|uniref:Uncharacterized protein n=1 Tax=Tenebrio molitor TaxID=7067 RepID=A0A8J6LDP7_TENMO|nr:hypothetical protein GEV33_013504 [Tenebrio molitor]